MSGSLSSGPRLTAEQERPLLVRGASVALSAGAGCGKTTVLTARFLRALEGPDRISLRSIVAVTFTEKAARELRQRIRAVCRERLRNATDEDAPRWRAIARGLEAAPVSTFHEYCSGLLKRHAEQAGVDPEFTVLDDTLKRPILDDALSRAVRRWNAEQNEDLIALGIEFGLARLRDALATLATRRDADELADWTDTTPEDVFSRWRAVWEAATRPELLRRFVMDSAAVGRLLEENETNHSVMRTRRIDVLDALQRVETATDAVAFLELIQTDAKVQGGGNAKSWPSPEVYAGIRDGFSALRKAAGSVLERLRIDEPTSLRGADLGRRLARLAIDVRRGFNADKHARGSLDFDDLLVKTRDLLRSHPEVLSEASGPPVKLVLVDEFQDTDPVQSEVLRRLGGAAFTSGGVFVVGDFKQSIYRFRGAQPEIFKQLRAELPEAGRLVLSENFRSAPGILSFVNALFAEAFPPDRPRLVPGPNARSAAGRAVEFLWAEDAPIDEEPTRKKPSADERRETEALWIARVIRARLDEGWLIVDPRSKQVRRAGAGDVALLFRALTNLAPYEQALEAEGLDYHVVGGSTFYSQQEVQDLVNVLSIIEDPLDEVSLAGALRGPFFGLSDEGLFWLSGVEQRGLWEAIENLEDVAQLSPADRRNAARAARLLERWRGLKDNIPIAALLNTVLDESGFEAALLGERLGDRKRANARKFVRLARRFDAAGTYSLGHFVDKLKRDLREPPREGEAATTDEQGDSVRLMSIHQAKGLEFPIVFVPDLNRKRGGSHDAVTFDPALGPLVRPSATPDPDGEGTEPQKARSLGWTIFEEREKAEDEAEALRLFYVAVTRARDRLVLSAGVGPDAKPDAAALKLLGERFDRGTGGCTAVLPKDWEVPDIGVIRECPPATQPPRGRRRRPNLGRVARIITSATPRSADGPATFRTPPRSIDLEEARGLIGRPARLDRLIRAILREPAFRSPNDLESIAGKVARRQNPVVLVSLVEEAVARIKPWIEGGPGVRLLRGNVVERGLAWSVPWTLKIGARREDVATVMFHGIAELVAHDPAGGVLVATVHAPCAAPSVETLRQLLSTCAVRSLVGDSGDPIQALGLGAQVHVEEDSGDERIELVVREVLDLLAERERGPH